MTFADGPAAVDCDSAPLAGIFDRCIELIDA